MTDWARAIETGQYGEIRPPEGVAAQLFILEAIPVGVSPTHYAHLVPSRESPWALAWYGERALRMARLGYPWQAQQLLEIARDRVDTNGAGTTDHGNWEGTPLALLADKIKDYCLVRRTLGGKGSKVSVSGNNEHDTADADADAGANTTDGDEGEGIWTDDDVDGLLPPFREQMDLLRVLGELPAGRRGEVASKLALNLKTISAADRCTLWSWRRGGDDHSGLGGSDAVNFDSTTLLPPLQRREWQRVTSLKGELLALRPDSLILRGRINRVMRLIAEVRELSRPRDRPPASPPSPSGAGPQPDSPPSSGITLSTFQELSRYEEFTGDLEELERLCIDELNRLSLEEGEPLQHG